jgi:isopenicillin-N epimerase
MPSELAAHWSMRPGVRFLNHGSYGATPRAVLAAQDRWRARMEEEPVEFLSRDAEGCLDAARAELAAFIGADSDDVAFVHNATTGINAVIRWLPLQPGDELLTTDHAYNAAKNVLEARAAECGARVRYVSVPFPGVSDDDVAQVVLDAATPRTRLVLLDHVTSATALVLPVARLVAELIARGIDTLVDGAHAPGMVELDVEAIGAAYYVGNCHKWLCGPKGTGFLHVRRDRQPSVRPLAISHGANSQRSDRSRFRLEFDWTGTDDPSGYLAVPDAIRFGASLLSGGWPALRHRNHQLAVAARDLLCEALGVPPPAPDAMLGAMAAVPLPPSDDEARVQGVDLYGDAVHAAFLARGIQVMVTPWPQRPDGGPSRRLIRVSAAAYNDLDDMRALADAARELVA